MVNVESISRGEVKRSFLLADAGKLLFEDRKSDVSLEEGYNGLRERFGNMGVGELDGSFEDKTRLERYNSMDWYSSIVSLKLMGVWPKMCGLPIEFTTGNVIETADHVGNLEESLKKGRLPNVDSIIANIGFVRPNFPLILFSGEEIREEDYNKCAKEHNQPLCQLFD